MVNYLPFFSEYASVTDWKETIIIYSACYSPSIYIHHVSSYFYPSRGLTLTFESSGYTRKIDVQIPEIASHGCRILVVEAASHDFTLQLPTIIAGCQLLMTALLALCKMFVK